MQAQAPDASSVEKHTRKMAPDAKKMAPDAKNRVPDARSKNICL